VAAKLVGGIEDPADDEEGRPKSNEGGKIVCDWVGEPGREWRGVTLQGSAAFEKTL
jgi:hypothetical protein